MILFKPEYIKPILSGEKTVTRRMPPARWNAGRMHQARVNYNTEPFAYLFIKSVRLERLQEMSAADLSAAGFGSKEEYQDLYRSFFPAYDGEIYAIEFECVTFHEYQTSNRMDPIKEGDIVKIIEDGPYNNMWYPYGHKFKKDGAGIDLTTRVIKAPFMLMNGVRVAYLEGISGYYDATKLVVQATIEDKPQHEEYSYDELDGGATKGLDHAKE